MIGQGVPKVKLRLQPIQGGIYHSAMRENMVVIKMTSATL
jgi:hypothetical protein